MAIVDPDQDGIAANRANRSVGAFNAQCRALQQERNLSLYTIGYDVPKGSFTNALERCIAGNGQYFAAGINDINQIFQNISSSFDPIRITN